MLFNIFRKRTLQQMLEKQLEETLAARVNAAASAAYWQAVEQFQLSEVARLNKELGKDEKVAYIKQGSR